MKNAVMKYDLKAVLREFQISGDLEEVRPFGSGHINDTFLVRTRRNGVTTHYVLQRINHTVFRNPSVLMDNIVRVTEHIRHKAAAEHPGAASRQLHVIRTRNDQGFFLCSKGNYWRLYNRVEGTVAYDTLTSARQAFEAARMFGAFQKRLADLPGKSLYETIPNFHDTPKRLNAFLEVLDEDPCNRAAQAKEEIDFVLANASLCSVLLDLHRQGKLPLRVTHNDTKINNILFDKTTREGVCVIDLDTVMPGLSLYDVGDMVRTATCRVPEDEQDLSKVYMDMALFEQIARGFAAEMAAFLTPTEKKYFALAGKLITLEQLIRFLADHLAGDVYYKIHRPGHNLDRARTQIKLIQSMDEQQERMHELTETIWHGPSFTATAEETGPCTYP